MVSDSATLWTAAHQASLSITIFRSLLRFISMESVMPSNHLVLCCSLLLLSSIFPSIFASGGQRTGASASASVLPMNIQHWFLLGLTGLISLQSKGLSRVFSNTTVRTYQFFGTQSSLWYNSHIHRIAWYQTMLMPLHGWALLYTKDSLPSHLWRPSLRMLSGHLWEHARERMLKLTGEVEVLREPPEEFYANTGFPRHVRKHLRRHSPYFQERDHKMWEDTLLLTIPPKCFYFNLIWASLVAQW